MFHNVLSVEYMLKMKKYSAINYITGLFFNFSLVISCTVVSFMRTIYLTLNPDSDVVRTSLESAITSSAS